MTGDQSAKALHLLAGHNCYNCKFCQDMMLTEHEVNDFTCSREYGWYCEFDRDGVCEYWEEDVKKKEDEVVIVATNLLAEKTCNNCEYYIEIDDCLHKLNKEGKIPETNTCVNWKEEIQFNRVENPTMGISSRGWGK